MMIAQGPQRLKIPSALITQGRDELSHPPASADQRQVGCDQIGDPVPDLVRE